MLFACSIGKTDTRSGAIISKRYAAAMGRAFIYDDVKYFDIGIPKEKDMSNLRITEENKRKSQCAHMAFLVLCIGMLLTASVPAEEIATVNQVEDVGLADYVETVYDEGDGMVASEANTVMQDQQGYLWIGSYGGLGRYNGHEFENISVTREGAPKTGIRVLYEDEEGRIWIGTNDAGVYLYQDHGFSRITEAGGETTADIANMSVRAIVQDTSGSIYLGTTDGLFVSDGTSVRQIHEPLLEGATVENLLCDQHGNIWGTSGRNEVFVLKDGQVVRTVGDDELGANLWNGLMLADDGSIYVGTEYNCVIRLEFADGQDGYSGSIRTSALTLGNKTTVNDIFQDRSGKIWVCTDSGTGYFDGDETFYEVQGLSGNYIMTSMCEDYEGNLWFASTRKGLIEFARSRMKNIAYEAGISQQTVNCTVLYNGLLYIGTDSGLAVTDLEGKAVPDPMADLLAGVRIRHLMVDSKQNLWIAAYDTYGAVRYNASTGQWRSFTEADGMPHEQVRMSYELEDGDIAVATRGGIAIISGDEVTDTYTAADGIQNEVILCMTEDAKGNLLAGSDGNGIYQINLSNREVINITPDDGLQAGVILRMEPDEQADGIWVSNGAQLALLKDQEIVQIPEVNAGVGSIFDIKVRDDELWLLKAFGVIRISRDALLTGSQEFETVTRRDGLTSSITANSWSCVDEDGGLYLCTGNGVYYFNQSKTAQNTTAPKIAVEKITVDDEVYYGMQDITLPSDCRRITIYLDLLSFGLSSGTLEYYMEGFDEAPLQIDGNTENQVTYTNLPGGDYTFHLSGINSDGMRSDDMTFTIQKQKSLYERNVFYVIVAALAVFAILLGIVIWQYWHKRRILKRQREYKELTEQTIRIIGRTIDAKDKYTIGHSNRVAAYAVEIGRRYGLDKEQLEQLHYSALLHDIGKIGIPDSILKKPGKLTDEEYEQIKQHPAIGGEILKDFTLVPWITAGTKYHHERYDGKGYNEGLKGEEIPLYARIISVADSYDSMSSGRVYRPPLPEDVIIQELEKGKGTQFDAKFADIMIQMLRDHFTAA